MVVADCVACLPKLLCGACAPDCMPGWNYQLDLTTPGISPLSARPRKHRRQTPNLRRNARGRPQSWQRLCWRDLNFGLRASLTRFAVVAMFLFTSAAKAALEKPFLLMSRRPKVETLGYAVTYR